ncbi:MAG: hypothetical protein BRD50_08060 [Bacteroidetes bacterium SW_11_45_7]|nr:MAG: hypothetical protein BRD50_08060 [Bacteroidetes bacterium SW_11_45_7]
MVEDILRGTIGIVGLLAIAFLLSNDRKNINWRIVITGIVLQFLFALGVLKVDFIREIFDAISSFFVKVLDFSEKGAEFVLGEWPETVKVRDGDGDIITVGYIFAFKVLPTIIFFSALSSLLYFLGILQKIVYGFAWVMNKAMRLSGAESLAAAANIFIGQTEAPLIVKPYLDKMTKSELMALMTGGMATIAGGVFAAYIGFLGGDSEAQQQMFASHLLSASIMSAPAAIVAAKMLFPEMNPASVNRELSIHSEKIGSNVLDAITNGTTEGLKLAVNVGAMLLTFIAMIAMFNYICEEWIGSWTGLNEMVVNSTNGRFDGFTLQYILGLLFSPFAWLLGVPSADMVVVGQLLGEKTVLNEFVAYSSLGQYKADGEMFQHQKSVIIATYALCGFANFASIGIQIGGIGAIAPSQRQNLSELGIKALIGGTIACFMTACVAGMLVADGM